MPVTIYNNYDMLNRELAKLGIWFAVNKLSLNLSKINYVIQGCLPDVDINLCINNTTGYITTYKWSVRKNFLGVIIDDDLNRRTLIC